jgi:hypothetical protein
VNHAHGLLIPKNLTFLTLPVAIEGTGEGKGADEMIVMTITMTTFLPLAIGIIVMKDIWK